MRGAVVKLESFSSLTTRVKINLKRFINIVGNRFAIFRSIPSIVQKGPYSCNNGKIHIITDRYNHEVYTL